MKVVSLVTVAAAIWISNVGAACAGPKPPEVKAVGGGRLIVRSADRLPEPFRDLNRPEEEWKRNVKKWGELAEHVAHWPEGHAHEGPHHEHGGLCRLSFELLVTQNADRKALSLLLLPVLNSMSQKDIDEGCQPAVDAIKGWAECVWRKGRERGPQSVEQLELVCAGDRSELNKDELTQPIVSEQALSPYRPVVVVPSPPLQHASPHKD